MEKTLLVGRFTFWWAYFDTLCYSPSAGSINYFYVLWQKKILSLIQHHSLFHIIQGPQKKAQKATLYPYIQHTGFNLLIKIPFSNYLPFVYHHWKHNSRVPFVPYVAKDSFNLAFDSLFIVKNLLHFHSLFCNLYLKDAEHVIYYTVGSVCCRKGWNF